MAHTDQHSRDASVYSLALPADRMAALRAERDLINRADRSTVVTLSALIDERLRALFKLRLSRRLRAIYDAGSSDDATIEHTSICMATDLRSQLADAAQRYGVPQWRILAAAVTQGSER